MNRFFKYIWIVCCVGFSAHAQDQFAALFNKYPTIVEKLIYFKHDTFKVFYGGPVDRDQGGVKWIMPLVFEDAEHKTRAVYEVAFINCDLNSAEGASIIFVDVSDINIKFKNCASSDYATFSNFLSGNYRADKYVVVRCADIAQVYYPDIHIACHYGKTFQSDKYEIARFLHTHFQTEDSYSHLHHCKAHDEIVYEDRDEIVYKDNHITINFDDIEHPFCITKRIRKNDTWKIYYIISCINNRSFSPEEKACPLVRLDSGCVSGQIYDDQACDCLDQLHDMLKLLAHDDAPYGFVIHIPAHDGRGFGTAPKAETEIYKRGGKGRIHLTESLDTVAAAELLYGVDNYDLRTFDGAAEILKSMQIKKVILLTDNVAKVSTLQKHGIEVIRQKTDTAKASCLDHIKAKKNSSKYFAE